MEYRRLVDKTTIDQSLKPMHDSWLPERVRIDIRSPFWSSEVASWTNTASREMQ